jgi:hypothetical protein
LLSLVPIIKTPKDEKMIHWPLFTLVQALRPDRPKEENPFFNADKRKEPFFHAVYGESSPGPSDFSWLSSKKGLLPLLKQSGK